VTIPANRTQKNQFDGVKEEHRPVPPSDFRCVSQPNDIKGVLQDDALPSLTKLILLGLMLEAAGSETPQDGRAGLEKITQRNSESANIPEASSLAVRDR
jgi:hypothetical protein